MVFFKQTAIEILIILALCGHNRSQELKGHPFNPSLTCNLRPQLFSRYISSSDVVAFLITFLSIISITSPLISLHCSENYG